MKVSISWLKELVNLNISIEELVSLLPLRSISTKEVTEDFIELDMKGYNRADLLSMRGVAQEVAAVTSSKLTLEESGEGKFVWEESSLPDTGASVESEDLCPFYCLAKIEGLKIDKSTAGWSKKLSDSGIRSVNNIADVTNLVMIEYGQPLHAFDADKVEGGIVVRTAEAGEQLVTLDSKTRKLNSSNLLIADSKKAIGIAGVMGGQNTEVTEATKTILLEAAIFDSISIRKTTTTLGLPSEAAKRFQHGLTKKRLLRALDAAIRMYQDLGGKLTAISLVGNFEDKKTQVKLSQQKLNSLVGIDFSPEQVEKYLTALYFEFEKTEEGWEVEVPFFRLDIAIEEDLIEEIARMYGYEKIPAEKVSESKALQEEDPIFKVISDLRGKLVDLGLTEVQTYSFYTTDVLKALGFNEDNKQFLVKLANPISAETEYLRMNLWPNLAEVVGRNLRKGFDDIAIFEMGKAFQPDKEGNPQEQYRLAIALSNTADNPLEELISITNKLDLDLNLEQSKPEGVGSTLFHPTRFVTAEKNGKFIGGVSEVHLRVLNALGIEKRVAVLEIDLVT